MISVYNEKQTGFEAVTDCVNYNYTVSQKTSPSFSSQTQYDFNNFWQKYSRRNAA